MSQKSRYWGGLGNGRSKQGGLEEEHVTLLSEDASDISSRYSAESAAPFVQATKGNTSMPLPLEGYHPSAQYRPCSNKFRDSLVRIPAAFVSYMKLQVRYRFGITIVLPRTRTIITKHAFPNPRRRYLAWLSGALVVAPFLLVLASILYGGLPPSYASIRAAEHALPQHHWNEQRWTSVKSKQRPDMGNRPAHVVEPDDSSEEQEELFLRFPDHLWGQGLNNVIQEAIMTQYITLAVNRTPVFEDYIWSHLPTPYTLYDFTLRPTRMPFGAFVGGFLSGQDGALNAGNNRETRAISEAYFDYVCPPSSVVEIVFRGPNPGRRGENEERLTSPWTYHGNNDSLSQLSVYEHFPSLSADGNEIREWFKWRLAAPDVKGKKCVAVREEIKLFPPEFFATDRILAVLPDLMASPMLKKFQWSALVRGVVDRIVKNLFPPQAVAVAPTEGRLTSSSNAIHTTYNASTDEGSDAGPMGNSDSDILPGVVAVHIRRGDFKHHCFYLRDEDLPYLGITNILLDPFNPPNSMKSDGGLDDEETAIPGQRQTSQEKNDALKSAYYMAHCLPSIEQIVQRLHDVRDEYEVNRTSRSNALREVYVLTNGWPAFMDELRSALKSDGWARVVGTPDWDGAVPRVYTPSLRSQAPDLGGGEAGEQTRLKLNSEERGVSGAIDMGIAERAEVFVGNGFSTLSSNVIMLRLARGLPVWSNRVL